MASSRGMLQHTAQGWILRPYNRKGKLGPEQVVYATDVAADLRNTLSVGGDEVEIMFDRNDEQQPVAMRSAAAAALEKIPRATRHTPGDFHNPYNFIPTPPRTMPRDSGLADAGPAWHDRLSSKLWSGKIHVRMTAATPLLIPDAAHVHELLIQDDHNHKKKHLSYPIRLGDDKRPLVAPTSVKGMLRSAYESVTDSRLGIFSDHDDRLGWRRQVDDGGNMVPVRIVKDEQGQLCAELYPGGSGIADTGAPAKFINNHPVMFAAWLPKYHNYHPTENLNIGKHGDYVQFKAVLKPHKYTDKHGVKKVNFFYYEVVDPTKASAAVHSFEGWICETGPNIDGKHDERIFFCTAKKLKRVRVGDRLVHEWGELIRDYRRANEPDIRKGCTYPPALRNKFKDRTYSSHIQYKTRINNIDSELTEDILCYAKVHRSQGGLEEIDHLYPVMISRDLQGASPSQLLDPSLEPANTLAQLSPADRVFGWVRDGQGKTEEASAYRGNLRVGAVTCETDDAVIGLKAPGLTGLPLAILGTPKPEQARFYVGQGTSSESSSGMSQEDGLPREVSNYDNGKDLRGRKAYPHQNVPDGYWEKPWEDRTQDKPAGGSSWYQEYRRPRDSKGNEQLDTQNHSMEAWVRLGSVFSFDIDVTNLSSVEFGALLWILSLGKKRFLKLGSGKPLGFGSVTLEVDWGKSQLGKGEAWAQYYGDLTATAPAASSETAKEEISTYSSALKEWWGVPMEQVPFIKAFLKAAEGFTNGKPSHYPRARQNDEQKNVPPSPEGESFKWFVANERSGACRTLPDLEDDQGLPYLTKIK